MVFKNIGKKETGMIMEQDIKSTSVKVVYWCFFVVMAVLALICLLPIVWIFLSAFKSLDEFLQVPPTIIPRKLHPEKIVEVWNMFSFGKYYLNSFIYVLGCWAFCIVCNGLGGYVLSKVKPKGYKMMFKIVFWSMMLPTSMNMIPLFMSFTDLPLLHINLTDTYWPLWFMHGIQPFTILLFKNFFDGIPEAYSEAAKIDGCSELRIFVKIMVPLAMPILLVVSIMCINTAWSEFMWPLLVIKDTAKYTVSLIVYSMSADMSIDKYYVVLLLSILPPLLVFIFFGRKMMGGVALGGVKG